MRNEKNKDVIIDEKEEEKERIAKEYKEEIRKKNSDSFKATIIILAFIFILFKFIILNGYIPSASMEPTINTGDLILVDRIHYKIKDFNRQDIIVFNLEDAYTIKRIIGLPGDEVKIEDGLVYVNGEKLKEAYIEDSIKTYIINSDSDNINGPFVFNVPEDSLFLLGDNRENSYDSRYWDEPFIDFDDVVGKLILKYRIPIISDKISEE